MANGNESTFARTISLGQFIVTILVTLASVTGGAVYYGTRLARTEWRQDMNDQWKSGVDSWKATKDANENALNVRLERFNNSLDRLLQQRSR